MEKTATPSSSSKELNVVPDVSKTKRRTAAKNARRSKKRAAARGDMSTPCQFKIYIQGIPKNVSRKVIEDYLVLYGSISSLKIVDATGKYAASFSNAFASWSSLNESGFNVKRILEEGDAVRFWFTNTRYSKVMKFIEPSSKNTHQATIEFC